jgi:FkbM family methyltransferase
MADFAERFPSARILGVELDHANAALARANTAAYAPRCEILQRAVWYTTEHLTYAAPVRSQYAYRVGGASGMDRVARGITMTQLIDRLAPNGADVDYVKMDIEGAEQHVLTHVTGWCGRVRALKVEYHDPYTFDQCSADLEGLGFTTKRAADRADCVVALRR